jgi:[protein-PII] uridylyltransferase
LGDTEDLNPTNRANDVAAQGRQDLESSALWQETERNFQATGRAADVQRALTQAVEQAAVEAFQASLAPAGGTVMLATGGFARGELFPYSNADILIVREGDPPRDINDAVAEFVQLLWVKGVRPNQRICTIAECLALFDQNVDLGLNLLDRRTLAGDSAVAEKLAREIAGLLDRPGQQIARRFAAQTRARHDKARNTPSHREPDVEETPGGLRDLRSIATLETLRPERIKPSQSLGEAAAFLSFVRCFLHYRARENRNLLDLPAQEAIARQFAPGRAPSLWMRDYFHHARAVFRETRRALDSCDPSASPAETVRDAADPEALFPLLESVARDGVPPAPDTERHLEAAKGAVAAWCRHERPLWPAIKTILSLPHAPLALRLLQRADLLSAVFPEWANIEGVATNDPDDAFTVDEHTLSAIERICDLPATADTARQRFRQLLSEIDDPTVPLFALLFHAVPGSAEAAARIRMPASDRDLVTFLIERQTSLSDVLSGRDLDDPATVRRLTDRIGTIERLRLLALLTYGDLTAASPEAMLPWRLDQLWRAYSAAYRGLTRELETDRIQEVPATLPESAEFIKGFPTRYLRARTAGEIAAHTQLYRNSRPTGVAVDLEPLEGAYRLTVVAQDRPALFASFAGAISSFGLDIVKAEAFGNSQGVILDTFTFADPKRTFELNPPEAERLQDLIGRIALGKTDARRLFRDRALPRPEKRAIEPQIQFDAEAHETATLVEIVAEDRLGLLYSLASVFSSNACNIDTVLIDTKGHRAIDVFYVAHDGKKLSPALEATLKDQLLSACLG